MNYFEKVDQIAEGLLKKFGKNPVDWPLREITTMVLGGGLSVGDDTIRMYPAVVLRNTNKPPGSADVRQAMDGNTMAVYQSTAAYLALRADLWDHAAELVAETEPDYWKLRFTSGRMVLYSDMLLHDDEMEWQSGSREDAERDVETLKKNWAPFDCPEVVIVSFNRYDKELTTDEG